MRVAYPNQKIGQINIELEFLDIEKWSISDVPQLRGRPTELSFSVVPALATIRLILTEGFLEKFYRADNLAEREIVAAIIRAAAEVTSIDLTALEIQQLVERATKSQNTRFFHIVRSSTLESALSGPESAEPSFIPLEEISRVRIGLAHRITENPSPQITDRTDAIAFLDKIVANLQESLCARLKQFQMIPVVSHSFYQLDDLSRDGTRWSLSTRSLIALADNAEWLHNRLRTESGRLALAEITNRALIETAVYSNDSKAKEHISQTEHATLLAHLAVMIELANHRDAIAGGFVAAYLKIHPNGMVDYDETFQQQVFQPYLTSRVDDRIRWDADTYDSNFEPPDQTAPLSIDVDAKILAFERVFQAEYGFPYEALIKITNHFDEQAHEQGRTNGTVSSIRLRAILKRHVGLDDRQIETFLDRFVLPMRSNWKQNLPKGCEQGDVLPWRFFRGLSVLVRPFVEVSRSPRSFAVSASHLHRWRRYLSHAILEGHLPEKLFQSQAMKSYLGSLADKKGNEFTKKVASDLQPIIAGQKVEIKLTELGAPQNPDLGDIDVLAWDTNTGLVFLIECKRLKSALTVRQVIQQLEEFRGDQTVKDSLAKHQRRVDWVMANAGKISNLTGIPESSIRWIPLLVTRRRVPMSFVDAIGFPKGQVVPAKELASHVTALLAQAKQPQLLTSPSD